MTESNNDLKWGYWRWSGLVLVVALAYSMLSLGSPAITADKFAENRPGGAVETPLPFYSKKAMEHIKTICNLGPRISGSEAMKKQQDLLSTHFQECGAKVVRQEFRAGARSKKGDVPMTNLIASFQPELTKRIILCAHYDTRPFADQETDPRLKTKSFAGANDGAAGAAFLMEFATHLKDLKTPCGVDLVLFDGEEYVFERGDPYFHGSKYFATSWKNKANRPAYLGAVLVDMIAGRDPRFPVEQNSWWNASQLVTEIYTIALQQKCHFFRGDKYSSTPVEDDHIALNQVGIPAIDIIDFDYPHWHRVTDTPENCSPEGLEQVAKVLGIWVQRAK